MLTRILSSIVVVVVGLIPTLIGGPVFAGLFVILGILGFREFLALASRVCGNTLDSFVVVGSAVIVAFGIVAFVNDQGLGLFAAVTVSVGAPILLQLRRTGEVGAFAASALAITGSLYLGLPVYAATTLRTLGGGGEAPWLVNVAGTGLFPWEPAPRGLAWALTVILATWLGDSAAYLVGRAVGRRPLSRVLSPHKTVEGALAGLIASAAVGSVSFTAFGLGAWWLGALVGALLGVAGQLGDLTESFYKRQAGVKDSGDLIPGHGGMLDRIDALLFAFPVGLLVAAILEGS